MPVKTTTGAAVRLALLAGAFALTAPAKAQTTYTWTATASGNFSTAGNWFTPPGVPPSGGDATGVLNFTDPSATVTATNDLGNPFVINRVDFNTYTANTFTLASAASNTIQLTGANSGINNNGIGAVTVSSTLNLNANVTFGGTGTGLTTLTGVISETAGPRSITIARAATTQSFVGAYILNYTAPSFTGGMTLDRGTIITTSTGATTLPFGTGGLSVTANGGTWALTSALTLGATGGNINVASGGTLRFTGSSALTLAGANGNLFTGGGNLAFLGNAAGATIQTTSTISGTLLMDISPYPMIVSSPGTVTLSSVSGSATGSLAAMTGYDIRSGGTLAVSNNVTGSLANADRLSDTAPIALKNGLLSYTGNVGGAAITENVGALTLSGYSTITAAVGTTAGATTLNFASAARGTDRGTALIRGTTLGTAGSSGFVTFAAAPALVGGGGAAGTTNISIIPWVVGDTSATGTGVGFATYGATGVRPLATATEYATTFTGTDNNVRLTASTANAATVTVNSLALVTSGAVTGAGTINVTSGAVFNSAGGTIANTLAFGSAEGLYTNTASATISGNITGTGGFTKSGTSTLTLSGTNTGLTGTLAINAGVLSVGAAANLPGTGTIVVGATSGGSVGITSTATALTVSRNIQVTNGWFTLVPASSGSITLSGNISGDGGIRLNTSGTTLTLSGTNTYKGPTEAFNGTIRINGDAALGDPSGAFNLGNGSTMTLALDANWTTSRPINFSLTSGTLTLDTGTFNAVTSGPFTNYSAVNSLASDTFRKAGTGTLTVNGAGPLSYPVVLNASGGSIVFGQNGAWNSASYTLGTGTSVVLDNTSLPVGTVNATATLSRIRNDATVSLGGTSTFRMTGNASVATAEVVGALSVTATSGNVVNVVPAGSPVTLTFASLSITSGGGLLFSGTGLGSSLFAGNVSHIYFTTAPTLSGGVISGATFNDGVSSGPASYDATRGVILFVPPTLSGNLIDNIATSDPNATNALPVPTNASFIVTGTYPGTPTPSARVNTGASINSLILDGADLTLYGGNVSAAGNGNTALGTFAVTNITSQNGAKTIFSDASISGNTPTVNLGASQGTITTTSDLTISSAITLAGSAGFIKAGVGTFTINGPYTNTGTVVVNAGSLVGSGITTLGGLTFNAGSVTLPVLTTVTNTLTLGSGTSFTFNANATLGGLAGSGTLNLGANSLTVNSTAATTFNGILNSTGAFAKTGSSTLTLAPTSTPSFSSVTVAAGTLAAGVANAVPAGTALVIGQLASSVNGTYDTGGFAHSFSGLTIYAQNSSLNPVLLVGTGTTTLTGNITLLDTTASAGNRFGAAITGTTGTLNLGGAVRSLTVAGQNNPSSFDFQISAIIANGGLNITANPSSTQSSATAVSLNAAAPNTYALGTTVNAGTLNVAATTSLGTGPVVLNQAGTVVSAITFGGATTIGTLSTGTVAASGSATITIAGGTTLTVNQTTDGSFGGVITNTSGALTKTGAAALALNGANTFTGGTTVTAGTLRGTGSLASAVTVNSGGFLQGGSIAAPVGTLTGGAGVTLTSNGGIRIVVNGSGQASLISLPTTSVLNLNPGAGNTFAINVTTDPNSPFDPMTQYTVALATVGTAGNIQLNGVATTANQTISPSQYTLTGANLAQPYSLMTDANNTSLVLTFTPAAVPEPASLLVVGGLAIGGVRWVRRRKAKSA